VKRVFVCLLLVFLPGIAGAKSCADDSAWAIWLDGRVRGINILPNVDLGELDLVLASAKLNALRVQLILNDRDIESVAERGLSAVPRLEARLRALDEFAIRRNLVIVLDIHRGQGQGRGQEASVWRSEAARLTHLKLVRQVAAYAKSMESGVAIDLFNEPTPFSIFSKSYTQRKGTLSDWNVFAVQLVDAVRAEDPCVPVVIESVDWAKPGRFRELKAVNDPRVIYSFHYYLPYQFTHQGINQFQKGISLNQLIGRGEWSRSMVDSSLRSPQAFQDFHNVPIFVGEVGVNHFATPEDRLEYLQCVVGAFEARGWSYAWHAQGIWEGWNLDLKMQSALANLANGVGRAECPF